MKDKIFELLQTIKDEEFAYITRFARTNKNNQGFEDYSYFLIEKEDAYFYIQEATTTDFINNIKGTFTVTPYKKINYNTKQQIDYPIGFNTYQELKNIILQILKQLPSKKPLKGTYQQVIHHELKTFCDTSYGKITLLEYLKKIAGYRELEILSSIKKITMNLNNEKYLVLEFFNKNNQSFAINAKNIERLIIS